MARCPPGIIKASVDNCGSRRGRDSSFRSIMKFACITCKRKENYLPKTLESFKEFYPNETINIFAEPETLIPKTSFKINLVTNETKLGTVLNWLNVVKHLCDYNDDYFMIIEDDIRFISEEIYNFPQTEFIVSPYCSNRNRLECYKDVWHWPRFEKWWCGACCLILPKKVIHNIAFNKNKIIELSLSETLKEPTHLDTAVGIFVKHKIITHTLSLIDHIGLVSCNEINNRPITPNHRIPALQ